MAQDETYYTRIYHERGANRLVVGSGGTMAIESGGSMQVADSGTLAILSGGGISIVTGASIGIAGTGFSPEELTRLIVSEQLMDSTLIGAASITLEISNLPKNLKVFMIAASTNLVSASFWLTSVSAGREVLLGVMGDSTGTFTNALTQIDVSASGCIILGSVGTRISRFTMNASAASDVLVRLIAPYDDVWAVVQTRGDVNEINNV